MRFAILNDSTEGGRRQLKDSLFCTEAEREKKEHGRPINERFVFGRAVMREGREASLFNF
jgi:hypothetical protein